MRQRAGVLLSLSARFGEYSTQQETSTDLYSGRRQPSARRAMRFDAAVAMLSSSLRETDTALCVRPGRFVHCRRDPLSCTVAPGMRCNMVVGAIRSVLRPMLVCRHPQPIDAPKPRMRCEQRQPNGHFDTCCSE